jgi:tetratricopeptide (TPR) repeat protein
MKSVEFVLLVVLSGCCLACGASDGTSVNRLSPLSPTEVYWERAHALEKDGNLEAAASAFAALCNGRDMYIRACYDRCRVLLELPDEASAIQCANGFVTAHPNHGLAPAMARTIGRTWKLGARYEEGAHAMGVIAAAVADKDVWDSIVYEQARLYRYAGKRDSEEVALMKIVDRGRWGSQLWDNAIWRVIAIAREKQNMRREEELLLQMLAAREESRLIASYNSPYYDDALFRLGEIHISQNELEQALSVFKRLSGYGTSRLRDDAILQCAQIRKQMGNMGAACDELRMLAEKMPHSSSARDAIKLFEVWKCSEVK